MPESLPLNVFVWPHGSPGNESSRILITRDKEGQKALLRVASSDDAVCAVLNALEAVGISSRCAMRDPPLFAAG